MPPVMHLDFDLACDREQTLAVAVDRTDATLAEHLSMSLHRVRATLDFREVFRMALAHNAYALAIAHTHPSGDPKPSRTDLETTRVVARLCADLGIKFADHISVARGECFSFRAAKML
jgi:DNA repair protein RadC